MVKLPPRLALSLMGLACGVSVALALLAQHKFGMEPCPWCILQRMIFIALAVLCPLAAALPAAALRRGLSALAVPLALGGIGAALWQHFVAAKSSSCALTFADKIISFFGADTRWPHVFEVRASCADAAASILGVPFEFWSLALFAVVGIALIYSAVTPDRRA
ncbi:MAG: disulfide bond formation protein B [Aquabacterium sp.]|uniref:disulfide bond formation protein B n=1 Tax=Aquabacterium sp. TaxID=1872578 RepID=UPI0025C543B1|nr:disulfide bond formation protein B [Aquabacterium sp.]MBI5926272.1 disulfide bond formation protein B [Aquabacterium sp.]